MKVVRTCVCILVLSILMMSGVLTETIQTYHAEVVAHAQADRFRFVTASLYVKDSSGNPVSNAEVKAFSEEWGTKYPRSGFQYTDSNGLTTFQLPNGTWSFFASRSLGAGHGLFVVLRDAHIDADSAFTLRANGVIIVRVQDVNGQPLDVQVRMMDSGHVPIIPTRVCGSTNSGSITLHVTSGITYDLLLFSYQDRKPGYVLLQRNVPSGSNILVRAGAGSQIDFEAYTKSYTPTTGFVQVKYYAFDVEEVVLLDLPGRVYLTPGTIGVTVLLTTGGWEYRFEHREYTLTQGTALTARYGGPFSVSVRVLQEYTQVWLETRDYFENLVTEFLDRTRSCHIPIELTMAGQTIYQGDLAIIDGTYQPGMALTASRLGQAHDLQAQYRIGLDLGPFGLFQLTGSLLEALLQYEDFVAPHSIIHAPRGFASKFNKVSQLFESGYTFESAAIDQYLPDGINATFYINVGPFGGFAGPGNTIGMGIRFSIDLPYETMSEFIGVAYHELAHKFQQPPIDWDHWEAWFTEPFACVLATHAIEQLLGPRIGISERGINDGFFRRLRGEEVYVGDAMLFVLYYLEQTYGWGVHKLFVRLWADNAHKDQKRALLQAGYSTSETTVVLYSYVVGQNLAWLFRLAGLDITEARIAEGLKLISLPPQATDVYVIAIPGAGSQAVSDPQAVASRIGSIASAKGLTVQFVISYDELDALVRNPPSNCVVINAHGEAVPMPASWGTSWQPYYDQLASDVSNHGWTFVSIVGYPLYWITSPLNPPSSPGTEGLSRFLLSIGGSQTAAWSSVTGSLTSAGSQAAAYFGLSLPSSQAFVRAVDWRGVSPVVIFYDGSASKGASAVRMGNGYLTAIGLPGSASDQLKADMGIAFSRIETVIPLPVSSVEVDVVNAPADSVVYVLPDWQTGSGHTKPPGVATAALSDFTALGFMYGASTSTQIMALDTNSTYFDPASGAPKLSNSVLVVFAGRGVNGVVDYYEDAGMSPVYAGYTNIGGTDYYAYWDRQGNLLVSMPVSAGQAGTSDMFLVEYFKDASNNKVFIIYGFAWKGTYIGGVFFKTYILPNIASFTHGWYIYRWDDVNSNGLPDPYEVNTTPVSFGD